MSHGLIVGWRMKFWRILSIRQICQTLATPNFRRLRYTVTYTVTYTNTVLFG